MAPDSSTFAWKIPWTEEPCRLQSMGSLESDMTEWLHFHFSLSCIGEGNGNPLQYSRLENPRDGGAWWAAVYGVAQSRTRLKRLSSSSSRVFEDTVGITVGESSLQQVFMALPPIATSVLCLCSVYGFGNVLFTCVLIHWSCIGKTTEMAFLHFGVNSFLCGPIIELPHVCLVPHQVNTSLLA